MRLVRWVVMAGVVVCWVGAGLAWASTAGKVKAAVARALARTAEESSVEIQVVGVGSWVSGRSYKDPLSHPTGFSDHDMRLVLPADLGPEKAKVLWRKFKQNLRQALEEEGLGRPRLLKSINVYPPDVLMRGVRDETGAARRLKGLGERVNLGGGEGVEGLYGPGARRWIREAEAREGVVFTRTSSGRVVQVGADIPAGWDELTGGPTLRGLADNADQFLLKAYKELAQSNPSKALKQLKRMRSELRRAQVRSGMRLRINLGELEDLLKEAARFDVGSPEGLEEFNRWFERNTRRLSRAMEGARVNVELLRRYSSATTPATRRLIEGMMEARAGSLARLRGALARGLKRYGRRFVAWAFGALEVVGRAAQAGALAGAARKEGLKGLNREAVRLFGEEVAGLAGVVVSTGLEMVRQGVIGMAIAQQECRDILEGVGRVWGHQTLLRPIDPREMAVRCADAAKARAFIIARINRLVDSSPELAGKLQGKCLSGLMRLWRSERDKLVGQVLRQWSQLEQYMCGRPLVLDYRGRIEGKRVLVRVRGRLAGGLGGLGERLGGLLKALQVLERGAKLELRESYTWWVGGRKAGESSTYSIMFTPDQGPGLPARLWQVTPTGLKQLRWSIGSGLPLREAVEVGITPGQKLKIGLKWVLRVAIRSTIPEFAGMPGGGWARSFSYGPMSVLARAEVGPVEIDAPRWMVSGSGAVVRARVGGVVVGRGSGLQVRWWLVTPSEKFGPKPGIEACVKPWGRGRVRLIARVVHLASGQILGEGSRYIKVLAPPKNLEIVGPERLGPGQRATYRLKGPKGVSRAWGVSPRWLVRSASGGWEEIGKGWFQAIQAGQAQGEITLRAELWSSICKRAPNGSYVTSPVKLGEALKVVSVSRARERLVVRVVDKATGKGLAGARVVVHVGAAGITRTTEASGQCVFELEPGVYPFAVSAAGYTGVSGRIRLAGGREAVVAMSRSRPKAPRAKALPQGRGRAVLLASFSGSVGGTGARRLPDHQAIHRLELPGPGRLKLVLRLYPKYKCHVKYGIGCRVAAKVSWKSPRSVAGSSWFYSGGTYMFVGKKLKDLQEVVSYKSIGVRGAGVMEVRFRGEACSSCKGRKSCCCFCCNWWWMMPAGYRIEAWFTPGRAQ